ncbi:Bestrophin, RFP-TM, chloride channel-domain-containing protein [Mycena sanguinolenta]|nr:Bestrophin, RFP-TM, chloride channel-domain-containing protein [Mycena sanguinolenta]
MTSHTNKGTAISTILPITLRYSWLPDVFRIKGSIISRIFGPVLTVTLFATAAAYANEKGYSLSLTNSIVPLLSVVLFNYVLFVRHVLTYCSETGMLSLLSAFDSLIGTRTSYDRYWEGRKCFGTLTSNVRNLSRLVWIQVAIPPSDDERPSHAKGKTPVTDMTSHELTRRKIEVLRLALAFVFAVKHYLRGEDGMHWEDYRGVLPTSFIRPDEIGYNTQRSTAPGSYAATKNSSSGNLSGTSSPDTLNRPDATKRVRPKRSKHQINSTTPLLHGTSGTTNRVVEFHPFADEASMPLPLAIAHEITRSLFNFRRQGFMETLGPAGANAITALVQSMVDQMTSMERVANTPIPVSYGIHLKQCVTLYLFALPLTLVKELGWKTIPLVTVVAFTFMGIEGIADEIEMPFGTDPGDLPLDRYCQDLKEEVDYIIERLPEGGVGAHGYDDGEGDD